jgi:hypothetical protein
MDALLAHARRLYDTHGTPARDAIQKIVRDLGALRLHEIKPEQIPEAQRQIDNLESRLLEAAQPQNGGAQ